MVINKTKISQNYLALARLYNWWSLQR